MEFDIKSTLLKVGEIVNCFYDEKAADLIDALVNHGEASSVLSAMIRNQSSEAPDAAINDTMNDLELFSDTHKATACILMCELWFRANKLHLRDICDSIDFWTESCNEKRHVNYLRSKLDFLKDNLSCAYPSRIRFYEYILNRQ